MTVMVVSWHVALVRPWEAFHSTASIYDHRWADVTFFANQDASRVGVCCSCSTLHLRGCNTGNLTRCRIRFHQPEQRTENAELSPQPPSDASLVKPKPCFGEGKQKGLYYASEQAGETVNPYCVILWPEPLVNPVSCPRTKRFFLRAPSADGAIQAALADNPHWRVIGIEPGNLFAGLLQGASSCPKPHDWHAA
jgi:hypothetical protein